MNTNFYIIIPEEFAFNLQSRRSTINPASYFGFAKTLDDQYVCSTNSVNDFPEEFAALAGSMFDGQLPVVALSREDFPQTPPIE